MGELLELAATKDADADGVLKAVFEWYYARTTLFIRGAVATAVTVLAAFLVAYLSDKADIGPAHIFVGVLVVVLLLFAALHINLHLAHLHREWVASLRLLHEFKEFQGELATYFKRVGRPGA
jgi:hypothetical protein